MLKYDPKMVEFHFTSRDLDEEFKGEEYDLELVVHAPEFWDNHLVDLCTEDDWLRNASVALIQKSVDVTRMLAPHFKGTPKMIVHPGAASLDHPIEDTKQLYNNLGDSVDKLDFEGVELLLENLPPHPWYFGGQWLTNAYMDVHEIIDFIEPRGLKICYDTSHSKLYCNWARVDFYEQVEAILPYITHLHLADASGLDGEGLQIEEGTIDWVRFFEIAKDYHGTMIPEIWRGHQRGGEGFLIALNRLGDAYYKAMDK
jgi:N-acetylneuraminate synthase